MFQRRSTKVDQDFLLDRQANIKTITREIFIKEISVNNTACMARI